MSLWPERAHGVLLAGRRRRSDIIIGVAWKEWGINQGSVADKFRAERGIVNHRVIRLPGRYQGGEREEVTHGLLDNSGAPTSEQIST